MFFVPMKGGFALGWNKTLELSLPESSVLAKVSHAPFDSSGWLTPCGQWSNGPVCFLFDCTFMNPLYNICSPVGTFIVPFAGDVWLYMALL